MSVLREPKIRHYKNFNIKKSLDNKKIWNIVKLLFSNKSMKGDKTKLNKNDEHAKT